jgi:hypothetical protein
MKRYSIGLATLLLLMTTTVVLAHKPIFVEPSSNATRTTAIKISDPEVSWAVYAQLSRTGEVNYYTFDGKRGLRVSIEMSVPRIESQRDFGFDVALIGKGLTDASHVPFLYETGEGAVVTADSGQDDVRVFDEPFTQSSYWQHQTLRAELPTDGTYTIAVYDPRGRTGKYVLAIGEREDFGAGDIVSMPSTIVRVHEFFGDNASKAFLVPVGIVAVIALILVGVILAMLRRSK